MPRGDHRLGSVYGQGLHYRKRKPGADWNTAPEKDGEVIGRSRPDPDGIAAWDLGHDEEVLPGAVILAHDQIQLASPPAVEVTEPGVLIALRVGRLVFLPQQLQRY